MAVGLCAVVLAATTLGPIYFLRFHFLGGFAGSWEDDKFVVGVFAAVYIAAACLLAFLRPLEPRQILWCAPLLALALMAPLSAKWSEVPELTFRRGLLFVGTTLTGFAIGSLIRPRELLYALAAATGAATFASTSLAIVAPSWGRQISDGAWSGLYFNRNSLAPVAALAVLSSLIIFFDSRRRALRTVAVLSVLVALATLVNSRGLSATLALVGSAAAWTAIKSARVARGRGLDQKPYAVGVSLISVGALITVWLGRAQFLSLFGRSPTLENRTPLWSFTVEQISSRPWKGFGFYTFWAAPITQYYSFQALRWVVPTAHNGFLETLLGLGIPGLSLLLTGLVVALWFTVRLAVRGSGPAEFLPMCLLVFAIVLNLTESFVLPNQLLWLVIPASLAMGVLNREPTPAKVPAP